MLRLLESSDARFVRGRIKRCTDATARLLFQGFLQSLLEWEQDRKGADNHGLIRVRGGREIACHVCGQYFTEMRHLQTHLQRSHPVEVVSKASRPTANEYVAHAVDGECATATQQSAKLARVAGAQHVLLSGDDDRFASQIVDRRS